MSRSVYLLSDRFEMHAFRFPEFDFRRWEWIETVEQRLSGVFFQYLSNLMRPFDDDRFHGVDQLEVDRVATARAQPIVSPLSLFLSCDLTFVR